MTHWQHVSMWNPRNPPAVLPLRSGREWLFQHILAASRPGLTAADCYALAQESDMTSDIIIWYIYICDVMWCDVMWCDVIEYDMIWYVYICGPYIYMIYIYIYTYNIYYTYIWIYDLRYCCLRLYQVVDQKKHENREKRSVPQQDTPVESSKPPSGPLSALRLDTSS